MADRQSNQGPAKAGFKITTDKKQADHQLKLAADK
jgi:hypothetical protein